METLFLYAEADDYKKMKLNMHIIEDKSSREAAFEICAMLKAKRSFLPVKDFLEGSTAKKKLEKWLKANQSKTETKEVGAKINGRNRWSASKKSSTSRSAIRRKTA